MGGTLRGALATMALMERSAAKRSSSTNRSNGIESEASRRLPIAVVSCCHVYHGSSELLASLSCSLDVIVSDLHLNLLPGRHAPIDRTTNIADGER